MAKDRETSELADLEAAISAEVGTGLARRLRLALAACSVPIGMFALADLRLSGELLPTIYALKLFALVIVAAGLLFLRSPRSHRAVVTVALLSAIGLYAVSTATAIVGKEPLTTPLLSMTIALSTATLLPWGVGAQLVLVGVALASSAITVQQVTGSLWNVITYPNVGVAIGMAASLYVARELERSRKALAARDRGQRRAEAHVRKLNEELEDRVVERTAQLERLNRALQQQITVRSQTEAELRRSEAALSALIEHANDAIWSVDREFRITAFNSVLSRRYHELFDAPLSIGVALGEAAPASWREYFRSLYVRALAGERFSVEQGFDIDNQTRHYLTSFNPIVTDGLVTGATIFSSDITERKHAEAASRQHQAELTHVLRLSTMGEMAAGLAHEINQPLGAIANYARGCSLRLRAGMGDASELARVIDYISVEALRAGEIIRRLRSLIRKESPREDWTDLNEIVTEVSRLLEPEARQQGVAVQLRLHPKLAKIRADGIQIEQVVLNLARNAIEAMADVPDARRELAIETATDANDGVELAVRDTGRGLDPSMCDKIFERFFTTKDNGLGMGLSISRTIIESHHGRLWATRNPEGGTTFRFVLPRGAAAAESNGSNHDSDAEEPPARHEAMASVNRAAQNSTTNPSVSSVSASVRTTRARVYSAKGK